MEKPQKKPEKVIGDFGGDKNVIEVMNFSYNRGIDDYDAWLKENCEGLEDVINKEFKRECQVKWIEGGVHHVMCGNPLPCPKHSNRTLFIYTLVNEIRKHFEVGEYGKFRNKK